VLTVTVAAAATKRLLQQSRRGNSCLCLYIAARCQNNYSYGSIIRDFECLFTIVQRQREKQNEILIRNVNAVMRLRSLCFAEIMCFEVKGATASAGFRNWLFFHIVQKVLKVNGMSATVP